MEVKKLVEYFVGGLPPKAEPMGYRETAAMDGAAALFPEVFGD